MRALILILIVSFVMPNLYGQKAKSKKLEDEILTTIPVVNPTVMSLKPKEAIELADELYEMGDKVGAYQYYSSVISQKPNHKYALYRLGETALAVRNYQAAHDYCKLGLQSENKYPKTRYNYAVALKHMGQYDKALENFDKYLGMKPNEEEYHLTAQNIIGCKQAVSSRPDRNYSISRLSDNINTGTSENGGTSNGDFLIFTSISSQGSLVRMAMNPGDRKPEVVNLPGEVNRAGYQNSDPFLSVDGKTLFFTRCGLSADGVADCAIFMGALTEEGKVEEVKRLNVGVNRPGFLSMQPASSVNEYGREILYFVSNRPGGFGGFDIWYSMRLANGEFTRAYNVGSRVNSDFNETTPFYKFDFESLFYSSDVPSGFGGYDIYRIAGSQRFWDKAANVGFPINSSGDDYYLRLDSDDSGYFSSNREGSSFKDHPNCCDDIYKIEGTNILGDQTTEEQ